MHVVPRESAIPHKEAYCTPQMEITWGQVAFLAGEKLGISSPLKHLPTMRETWVQSLGWEDPLEKAMAPHSSTLAWKIPWMEEPGRLQSMGSLRVGQTERLPFHFSLSCIGEGNDNPL